MTADRPVDPLPTSAARIPTFDDTFIDAFAKAMTTYTVGPGNVERVIDLTVNDIVAALRPVVEAKVRWHYEAVRDNPPTRRKVMTLCHETGRTRPYIVCGHPVPGGVYCGHEGRREECPRHAR